MIDTINDTPAAIYATDMKPSVALLSTTRSLDMENYHLHGKNLDMLLLLPAVSRKV